MGLFKGICGFVLDFVGSLAGMCGLFLWDFLGCCGLFSGCF